MYGRGVTKGAASTVTGSGGTGISVNGTTTSTVGSGTATAAPNTYSAEVWFATTSNTGGKLVGFGNSQTGSSTSYDRHVYMLPSGQLVFGASNGGLQTATSPNGYNDGKWHQVVATQGANGMRLYVDGQLVATNPNHGRGGLQRVLALRRRQPERMGIERFRLLHRPPRRGRDLPDRAERGRRPGPVHRVAGRGPRTADRQLHDHGERRRPCSSTAPPPPTCSA